ncbi:LysR family transcriptional regulator [Burkholderia sp. Ac-20379]|uniref:LysR family transcriptional regulator n=1 Tax=Burkholderia sp. Ac-20379 TaxID=2703900 RepID=UPI00197EA1C9|nr:LysR family transcriptional regulator [Burkholderia sp. Ac-20379]MBN3728115.1 LysR family transcriptional regulator [Burkholderia sp. Ac-20379]
MRSRHDNLSSGIAVFVAVVETGTFAAASEAIGMTPPGVSRAIARLEKRLGIRLFNRTTRSVSLTDEGRRFHERVLPHLAGLEEAAATAAGDAAGVRGRLRVNLDPVCYALVLGAPLGRFMDAHPELDLECIARDTVGDLVLDGFDLAIQFGEPKASTLIARKLLDTAVVTVAAPAYLARHGRPAKPEDLAGGGAHRVLEFRDPLTGRPFRWEFHRKRRHVEVATRGRLTLNDPSAQMNACLAGLGVAQMLAIAAEPMIAAGQLVNLFPDWSDERFPLYAYYPSRQHLPARTRVFLDFVIGLADAAQGKAAAVRS